MTAASHPFSYFFYLILENGRDELWNEFVPGEQERANSGLISFDPHTGIKKMVDYDAQDQSTYEYSISFIEDELKIKLIEECKKIRIKISDECRFLSLSDQEGYFTQLARDLKDLFDNSADKIKSNNEVLMIKRYLIFTQNHITKKYAAPNYIESLPKAQSSVKSRKSPKLKGGFKRKEIQRVLLQICDELESGNSNSIDPGALLDAIEAINSEKQDKRFVFFCKTTEAAYILYHLTKCYNDLSWRAISDSNLFFSKKGEPLSAGNLSKSYNAFDTSTPNKNKEKIDEAFQSLQKQ